MLISISKTVAVDGVAIKAEQVDIIAHAEQIEKLKEQLADVYRQRDSILAQIAQIEGTITEKQKPIKEPIEVIKGE